MTSSSFPPHSSSSSMLHLNTGQVFDCAKDKSSIVNGKQLLANKPLNVGITAGSSHHSLASLANVNNNNINGSGSNNKKARDKHKTSNYASDDPGGRKRKGCCRCMGPKSTAFWISLLTNLAICTLLFAYTLLGGSSSSMGLGCHNVVSHMHVPIIPD